MAHGLSQATEQRSNRGIMVTKAGDWRVAPFAPALSIDEQLDVHALQMTLGCVSTCRKCGEPKVPIEELSQRGYCEPCYIRERAESGLAGGLTRHGGKFLNYYRPERRRPR